MDEQTPFQNFLAFLKLCLALVAVIVFGIGVVLGAVYFLVPEDRPDLARGGLTELPAYDPEPLEEPEDELPPEIAAARTEYEATKEELEAALAASNGAPPVFETQIGIVESAVMDIVSALALSPGDRNLQDALIDAQGRQLNLLQKALKTADRSDDEVDAEN